MCRKVHITQFSYVQEVLFIIALYWFILGEESVNIGYLLLLCTGSF